MMDAYLKPIFPEMILVGVALILFLFGASSRPGIRRVAAGVAVTVLGGILGWVLVYPAGTQGTDIGNIVRVDAFAQYIKVLTAGVGILLMLLAWPTNRQGTSSNAIDYGPDGAEFYALMLLSLAGVFLVAGANDIILLFLGIELAAIPTYIMVSISRPLPAAQEAGLKYFFLGAMAAAVMLFGFSYLYGTCGTLRLDEVAIKLRGGMNPWQLLAVVLLIGGFAFKMAAVPLHFYAGDVYQGAATPVTAFLAFVPKTSGFVALIKILFAAGGGAWVASPQIAQLLWVMAVLTMTVGNVLGLLQYNVKRLLAYSSISHTGYMLVGVAALVTTGKMEALAAVLFYLAAYGIMNTGAFGILMLLPSSTRAPATTAETFEDLAGQGRRYPALGLAMAVCCFSLIGLPATVGFFGKVFLIKPALDGKMYWLVVLTVVNAVVSAAYYLRIVGVMFLRAEDRASSQEPLARPLPVLAAVALSVLGTVGLGVIWPATQRLSQRAIQVGQFDGASHLSVPVK